MADLRRYRAAAACVALLMVSTSVLAQGLQSALRSAAVLHLIDTGEGQAVVLDMGNVEIIIDGGESESVLQDYLERTGLVDGPIELIVVSHTHTEAYLGLSALFEPTHADSATLYEVREVWLPGDYRTQQEIRDEAAGRPGPCALGRWYQHFRAGVQPLAPARPLPELHAPAVATGEAVEFQVPGIPSVHFTVLSSGYISPIRNDCSTRRNNASTVLIVRVGNTRILFGGDALGVRDNHERAAWVEAALLNLESEHPGTLAADILIVPYRGGSLASSPEYIAAVNPRFALFGSSVRFLHPRPEIMDRYRDPDRRLLYTRLNSAADRDHIACEIGAEIDCRYAAHNGSRFEWTGRLRSGVEWSETKIRMEFLRLRRPMIRPGERPEDVLARVDNTILSGADLSGIRWKNCLVSDVLLSRVSLRGAELEGCEFTGTDFTGADFSEANLRNVVFREVKLDGAKFDYADLRSAKVVDATMDSVHLRDANISGLVFEPIRWSMQNPQDLWRSPHLQELRYESSPHALYELREELKNSGLRRPEREVTYIIERAATVRANAGERILRWLAFDITSEYGRSPARPILILFTLIPLFALMYWVPIRLDTDSGVYRIPPDQLIGLPHEISEKERVRAGGMDAIGRALQFSILSAFHLGWRELNVGNWIARMQPRSYGMTASGWVRTVTGIQALISVYLLALSVMTYFGRPFG